MLNAPVPPMLDPTCIDRIEVRETAWLARLSSGDEGINSNNRQQVLFWPGLPTRDTMNLEVLYWIVIVVMAVGVIGTIAPMIPGVSLILGAIVVWLIATGFSAFSLPILAAIVILILGLVVEYLAAYLGARQFGASNWAQIGAVVGLLVGLFGLLPALPLGGPIIGVLVGPVLGAFIGEFLYRRSLPFGSRAMQSLRACVGVIIGTLIGNVIEVVIAIIAVVLFVLNTFPPNAIAG
jgi:uncharacterized protein